MDLPSSARLALFLAFFMEITVPKGKLEILPT